jgi:molybdopterin-guanine dinucleotide biosynthesis protein A
MSEDERAENRSTRLARPGLAAPLGVVLAGGASSRMGADKPLLRLPGAGGTTLVEHAAWRLGAVCLEVVVADRGRGLVPGLRSIEDGPGRGPAAGLLGAARCAPGRPLLALACDLPAVPEALLAELAGRGAADCAAPSTESGGRRRIETLVCRYSPRALAALAGQVAGGRYALRLLFERRDLVVELLEGEDLARFGDPAKMLANLNTPEDLERLDASPR